MLFIVWGPLKYKKTLNCFEVQLVPFNVESAGVHALGLLVAALCHTLIYLLGPVAERMQRVTQCMCCPLRQTALLFCPLESRLAKKI